MQMVVTRGRVQEVLKPEREDLREGRLEWKERRVEETVETARKREKA